MLHCYKYSNTRHSTKFQILCTSRTFSLFFTNAYPNLTHFKRREGLYNHSSVEMGQMSEWVKENRTIKATSNQIQTSTNKNENVFIAYFPKKHTQHKSERQWCNFLKSTCSQIRSPWKATELKLRAQLLSRRPPASQQAVWLVLIPGGMVLSPNCLHILSRSLI